MRKALSYQIRKGFMKGTVSGGVRVLLRLEGLCILMVSIVAYAKFGSGWGVFFLCFLVPDLSFAGYLAGSRVGAVSYNCAHSLVGALTVMVAGVFFSTPFVVTAGIIWVAHIGFDRALGYGLKYSTGFRFTHLGVIGHKRGEL